MKVAFLNWVRELLIVPFTGDRESLAVVPVRHEDWQRREDERFQRHQLAPRVR